MPPRENFHLHPLDEYETALRGDADEESPSHDLMLAIVFTCVGMALLSIVILVAVFFASYFWDG